MLSESELVVNKSSRKQLVLVQDYLRVISTAANCLLNSGSARVFGYSVFRGVLNRVYGILQLKYGYSVYHFL